MDIRRIKATAVDVEEYYEEGFVNPLAYLFPPHRTVSGKFVLLLWKGSVEKHFDASTREEADRIVMNETGCNVVQAT